VGIVEKGSFAGGATKESYRVRTWEMSYGDQSKRNLRVENAGFSSGYNSIHCQSRDEKSK
jgi:hypothetical protein